MEQREYRVVSEDESDDEPDDNKKPDTIVPEVNPCLVALGTFLFFVDAVVAAFFLYKILVTWPLW